MSHCSRCGIFFRASSTTIHGLCNECLYGKSVATKIMVTDDRIESLQRKLEIAKEAFSYINDVAPPMYKYNSVEFKMVTEARKALSKLEEMKC